MFSLPQHIPTLLRDIYYNVKNPASYSSVNKIFTEAKKHNNNVTRKHVKEYLTSQFPFSLHHRVVRNFRRNPIVVSRPNELMQGDLIDLQSLSKSNDNIKFILTLIDVFSKKAYAFPMTNKSGIEVKTALETLFKEGIIPQVLETDSGKEFLNGHVQSLLKKYQVMHKTATNERIKCAVVERFQRTLQAKLFKYLTATGGDRYIDILQDAIDSYNDSVHSSTGMRPKEVTFANREVVFRNMYGVDSMRELLKKSSSKGKPQLKVGDIVRIARTRNTFRKGYVQTFSDELYRIENISPPLGINALPLYKLSSLTSKRYLRRRFYPQEVVKVATDHQRPTRRLRDERTGVYGYH